jgi:H/ACA ribonucleoprotein complex subunit 2
VLGAKEGTVKRGIKEVVKTIRRGKPASWYGFLNRTSLTHSFVLIAGDISPIDVITHLPVLCEENEIPYIFVPSKEKLGQSSKTKRATSCVLVSRPNDKEVASKFDEARNLCIEKRK